MPKRPRSHEIEELSRNRLHHIFGKLGWVVWDLHPDYGEDLLVRIFIDSTATHYSFFVQAKATDNINRYIDKDGKHLNYSIDIEHLKHWSTFWEPVILTIWDAKSDITYWSIIQDYNLDEIVENARKKTIYVKVPIENVVDEKGLQSIIAQTKRRFRRFEQLSAGTGSLIKYFEEEFEVKVDYDFEEDLFIIKKPSGLCDICFFDELAEHAITLATKIYMGPSQFILMAMLQALIPETKVLVRNNGNIYIFSHEGDMIASYEKTEDFDLEEVQKIIARESTN